jgi:site-specific DNA-methyltransferase (cytosine-N4-specific)
MPYFDTLPQRDQSYLKNWFSDQVLRDLDQIVVTIDLVQDLLSRNLMRIALSNILRRVSWQKEDDLRIRKEVRPDVEIDPIREFLEEIGRSVRAVLAFLRQNGQPKLGQVEINEGDARQAEQAWAKWIGKVDVIITSPPYATALPYIETDRLSLCYLSLLTRPEHRVRDDKMIGNREVTERGRMAYWALYERHRQLLPRSIQTLIDKIAKLNDNGDVGFRRRNLAALLAKYFLDLRAVLVAMAKLLKQGAIAYIVVGNNHTTAGAERVEIDTPSLLADLGELVGFQQGNHRSMQMLVSRDIFKKNAGTAEVILEMRRYT